MLYTMSKVRENLIKEVITKGITLEKNIQMILIVFS